MRQLNPDKIKNALEEEFSNIEPSERVWQGVADALPASPNRYSARRRTYRAIFATAILVISVFSLVAAGTDPGREMIDRIFNNFGIHVVGKTPQLDAQLEQQGVKWEYVEGMPLQENMDKLPANMKRPTYLPKDFARTSVYVYTEYRDASVRWADEPGETAKFVKVDYHDHAFGEGSTTITNGEAAEMQEVQIGNIKGFAFKDKNGWNISWAMDGHQYGIMTNISLEEAMKVAESIK